MAGDRERWRLDDWMRPAQGEQYTPRLMSGEVLPVDARRSPKPARRGAFSSIQDITPKDRRSMAWGLALVAAVVSVLVVLRGVESGLVISAGPLLMTVFYAVALWRTRHVGWRTEPPAQDAPAQTAPAQTPTAPAP